MTDSLKEYTLIWKEQEESFLSNAITSWDNLGILVLIAQKEFG